MATRHIAMRHLGLSHDDVYIQANEARPSMINGLQWNNRSGCGEVGKAFEAVFGHRSSRERTVPW
jgi:hypothetical protein